VIDASPSLSAARLVDGSAIVNYLSQTGWTIRRSKIPSVVIARQRQKAQAGIFFVLPLDDKIDDSLERRADALRTIAAVEGRPVDEVVQAIKSNVRPSVPQIKEPTRDISEGWSAAHGGHRGTVKFFNREKGYGFIQPADGGKDVFVHISAVERAGMSTLVEGQEVVYDVVAERGKLNVILKTN
jgi:cold shock protein